MKKRGQTDREKNRPSIGGFIYNYDTDLDNLDDKEEREGKGDSDEEAGEQGEQPGEQAGTLVTH